MINFYHQLHNSLLYRLTNPNVPPIGGDRLLLKLAECKVFERFRLKDVKVLWLKFGYGGATFWRRHPPPGSGSQLRHPRLQAWLEEDDWRFATQDHKESFQEPPSALDDFQGLAANAGPAEWEYEGQSFCSQMSSRIEPPFGGGAQRWKGATKSLLRLWWAKISKS